MSFVGKAIRNIVGGGFVGQAMGMPPIMGAVAGGIAGMMPKAPGIAPLPSAPSIGNSSGQLDASALAQQKAMMGGRTSTMLTGGAGFEEDTKNTSKILLGQ